VLALLAEPSPRLFDDGTDRAFSVRGTEIVVGRFGARRFGYGSCESDLPCPLQVLKCGCIIVTAC